MKLMLSKLFGTLMLLSYCIPSFAAGNLTIFTWVDYTPPELIKKFEEKYDVKVTIGYFNTNDHLLSKLKVGSAQYDIAVPTSYMVDILIREGLVEKVQPNKMSNFKYLLPEYVDVYYDPGREYSVLYSTSSTGVAIDTAKFKGEIPQSWSLLFDPPEELRGKISVMDEIAEVLSAGLYYLGYPTCTQDTKHLKELNQLLIKAKPYWRVMTSDDLAIAASGDVAITQMWSGDALRIRLDTVPTLKFIYPKEGSNLYSDNLVVLKNAPNIENAKLFMNFMMEPENAAAVSNFTRFATGYQGVDKLQDPVLKTAPELHPPAGVTLPVLFKTCDQETMNMYDKIWTNVKKQ